MLNSVSGSMLRETLKSHVLHSNGTFKEDCKDIVGLRKRKNIKC